MPTRKEELAKAALRHYGVRMDDDGRWITTENGHRVHLNEEGEPDKGNPHVVDKMTDGKHSGKEKEKGHSKSVKPSAPVDVESFQFTNYRNPDGKNTPGYETYRKAMKSLSDATEKAAKKVLKSYSGGMKPYDQLFHEFSNSNGHSAVRDIISPSSEQGLKDCHDAIIKRQSELQESMKDYTKWDREKREWVKP